MKEELLQEIIDFFELEDGYDKSETIEDVLGEIRGLEGYAADEIGLEWDGEYLQMTLIEFAEEFYDKVIEKVCNVIGSFQ